MNYPLVAKDTFIYGSTGELIAVMEPGPFAQGRINARDLVELANLGYRTRQHETELRNLTEIKGEPSFAFSPSVMVEFTKEEFSNFQVGITALRHLAGRTETPEEKKVGPASTEIAEGWNPHKLTKDQVGKDWRLLNYGEIQKASDQYWEDGEWVNNWQSSDGCPIEDAHTAHRRRIS